MSTNPPPSDEYRRGYKAGQIAIFTRIHDAVLKRFPYLGFALNEALTAVKKEIDRR
jgi:hypothetical protein